MRHPRQHPAVLALLLGTLLLPVTTQAATPDKPAKSSQSTQPVSLLGGKLVFTLPAGYVKSEMPEIDAKAIAEGVSGAMYTDAAHKRVLIVTETPNPVGVKADDNDTEVLDELSAAALRQQGNSFQDFQKLGEQRILGKNGLGIRQLDAQASLGGGKVLTTTLVAASGERSAVLNVISSAKDPQGHAAALKNLTGR